MAKKDDYIFRYRIRNWRTCNQALVQRGSITVWFDEDAINAWCNADPSVGPGTPKVYSDAAIQCALALKAVFHLSLRATQGFLASIMELMALDLPVPDYTTVSRRQRRLAVPLPESHHAHHIVVDATGLKVYGPGEWHAKKHPAKRRRSRRKLHLAVDETTKEIVA